MPNRSSKRAKTKQPISLLLVEGETEEVFYQRVKDEFLKGYRCKVICIGGLYNVNRKIVNKVFRYQQCHSDELIRVYCCLDKESRYGMTPDFDIAIIKKRLLEIRIKRVLSVKKIIATQDIESWFFHDLDGIYRYLKVKRSDRNPQKYNPPERYNNEHLKKLFSKHGKEYRKGKRAGNFISKLNLKRIISNCNELKNGIELIK
jgi:hypothetical protein